MEEALHAHLRQPILKILHSHGITRASSVSLNVLSSLLDRYLKSALESCQEYANHAGRVNLNVYDVLESLDEMGTVLDDLRDYLEVECGVVRRDGEEGQPATTTAEPAGVQRYAKTLNPRKEAELQEFKESLRQGLPALEDRIAQRVRFTRLQTPDGMEHEAEAQASRTALSDSDYDEPVRPDKPAIQLPLSPISNSPPHNSFAKSTSLFDDSAEDSAIPSFLPPFPLTVLDDIQGDSTREKEEELKREVELRKQKEAEEQEKQKAEEGTVVVQSFPANYIVPAPYEVSKLQARGTWHLPSISLATMEDEPPTAVAGSPLKTAGPGPPPSTPFVRGSSTTEELLSALHSLTTSSSADPANPTTPTTFSPNAISTNPQRHKVSLVFLGTTPMRYNTPDTLFGLNAPLGPTTRPANPLPTHVSPIEPQPGLPAKGKKQQDLELITPPAQGRSVGVTPNVIQAVTGTSSRIPTVGRRLLAKPTLLRTKRLAPPPAQKHDDKFLLYHAPDPPLPALWNLAVSGSNSQYGGTGVTAPDGKSKLERNPYGVVEAHMAYTWDWTAKVPYEGIEKVKGAPPPPPGVSASVNGLVGTPGGSGTSEMGPPRDRVVPKIHVNFPGRRSSTLSSVTPASGSGLIARLPGLAERSPSHAITSMQGSMPPPPVPVSAPITSRIDEAINALTNHVHNIKEETESPMEMTYGSKKSTQVEKLAWSSSGPESSSLEEIPKVAKAIVNGLELEADIDAEILDVAGDNTDDIDADIAEVIGDENEVKEDENADEDIDAALGDTLGLDDSSAERKNPSPPSLPLSAPKPPLDDNFEEDLEDLLEQSADAVPSKPVESTLPNGHDMDIDILGIGEPPVPPGEGSAYILSEVDYAPASEGGTLKFAHSTTLPLATSALRTTTTPLHHPNGHHLPIQLSHNGGEKLEDQTLDSLDDELVALTGDASPREESPRTTLLHIT